MQETEAALMQRCQAGDKEAFGVIVKRYAGAARGAAYMLLGGQEDAFDASQEAFVRAWRAIGRFDTKATFYPWYARILRNVCISRLRRRKIRTVQLADSQPEQGNESDPVLLAERNERRDRIWRAIMQLPLRSREVVVMKHFQELSYNEMAAALEIPVGTVMSRLHTARQALREKLAGEKP